MKILSDKPIQILNQGLTDSIVQYKNIEKDIPLYEQKIIDSKPALFKKEQTDFNSIEVENQKLREKYSNVQYYEITALPDIYLTQKFKLFKINQIISVTEYLLKVLKLILSINGSVEKAETRNKKILASKSKMSETDKKITYNKAIIANIFELLWEVKISIADLENDPHSFEIKELEKDIEEMLQVTLSVKYVPDEAADKIDAIFENIPLKKLSSLSATADKIELVSNLEDLRNRLYLIINVLIFNLSNQFSFYVTSSQFLNNPKGKTIFVIPASLYRMFNFYNSGLTQKESIKIMNKDLYKMDSKYAKFYASMNEIFSKFLETAQQIKKEIKECKEFFNIQTLLDNYHKHVIQDPIKQVQTFIADPVVFEKMTQMVQKAKISLVASMSKQHNPWQEDNRIVESKDMDNSTIYFLLKLFEKHPAGLSRFPQMQIMRFLNLCYYSSTLGKCMNDHVRKYKAGTYYVSISFENIFLPILMC